MQVYIFCIAIHLFMNQKESEEKLFPTPTLRNRIHDGVKTTSQFPYLHFESSIDIFFFIFFIGYLITIIILGFFGIDYSIISISIIVSLLGTLTIFFDFEWLRGIFWVLVPAIIYALVYSFVSSTETGIGFFAYHLAIFIVMGYLVYILIVEHKGTNWWEVLIGGFFWIAYFTVLHTFNLMYLITPDPNKIVYPYNSSDYPNFIQVLIYGTILMTALFYCGTCKKPHFKRPLMNYERIIRVEKIMTDTGEQICFNVNFEGKSILKPKLCFACNEKEQIVDGFAWDDQLEMYCSEDLVDTKRKVCIKKAEFDILKKLQCKK
jgi:hypothetical protein